MTADSSLKRPGRCAGTAAITSAPPTQNAKNPSCADSPRSTAPAAPGKPMSARVWPAKVWRRNTMNHPTVPASTATMEPARKALTMNWNSNRSRTTFMLRRSRRMAVVVVRGRFGLADDDEPAVGRAQHLDRRAVEVAERLAGDHLVRRPGRRAALSQVHHPIDVGQ